MVTIYSKFCFDYHLGKQSGKENAHSPLKISRFSTPLWHFHIKEMYIVNVILLQYQRNVLSENFR